MALLTAEQKRHFLRNGFVVLRGAIDPSICAYLTEQTWQRLPSQWKRDDPGSWTGEVTDSCHRADLDYRRGLLKFQKGDLATDAVIASAFGPESSPHQATRELFGNALAPIRVRGLYPNVPAPSRAELRRFVRPHVEAHPATTVALTYLSAAKAESGELLVWPGSHRELYGAFESRMDFNATADYQLLFDRYSALKPLSVPGEPGDVVLTHHRLFHAPSLNRSDRIRFAFLCDYTAAAFRALCVEPPGALWEDWGPMQELEDGGAAVGAPDYVLEPWPEADLVGAARPVANASSINKRDASALARSRHRGDVWLMLADVPLDPSVSSLDPMGNRLDDSVAVRLNGALLHSFSHNGFVTRLDLATGGNTLVIEGAVANVWSRLVRVESPMHLSRVLYCGKAMSLRLEAPRDEPSRTA